MTEAEFEKIRPGKTILNVATTNGMVKMLVKFFLCDPENFDEYWLLCTPDLTNPSPQETVPGDWEVYIDHAEVIEF